MPMNSDGTHGLSRTEAARWVTRRTHYSVAHASLRNWERGGLLREQRPGRRVPCSYRVPELIRAEVIAVLRRDGASLKRVRRALRALARLIPNILERRGDWRLAVDGAGELVRLESAQTLLALIETLGQPAVTLTVFDADAIARDACVELGRRSAQI